MFFDINKGLKMDKKCLVMLVMFGLFCPLVSVFGQSKDVNEWGTAYQNWYNRDISIDAIMGVSVDKAYLEILTDSSKVKKKVIVAVIDSGVDIEHEDLRGKIWVNQDEIPGNGIDDDGNGYVDDIHGWNFLGNSEGENIQYETMEFTRIVREEGETNEVYQRALSMQEKEIAKREKEKENITAFSEIYTRARSIIYSNTKILVNSLVDLDKVQSSNEAVVASKNFLKDRYEMGFSEESMNEYLTYVNDFLDYRLNTEFDPRSVIGDDPLDINDKKYGNPDVKGPAGSHGTGVAALIAANRANEIGIDGIAQNVEIMAIRSTPDGDERDKDVALAIRYAVDNGADIINMSFGKNFSPQKEFVDAAVKYAEEEGVLLVHAAGNDGKNIDEEENYPSATFLDGNKASNWIEVGATAIYLDQKVAASFSNYGQQQVDIFAPGHDVITADTSSYYNQISGTSFAAPVVSGVAALVLSYYPDLSPAELIDILMTSSYQFKRPRKVLLPGDGEKREKTKFKELSKSGGIVNAYEALLEAEKRQNLRAQASN